MGIENNSDVLKLNAGEQITFGQRDPPTEMIEKLNSKQRLTAKEDRAGVVEEVVIQVVEGEDTLGTKVISEPGRDLGIGKGGRTNAKGEDHHFVQNTTIGKTEKLPVIWMNSNMIVGILDI